MQRLMHYVLSLVLLFGVTAAVAQNSASSITQVESVATAKNNDHVTLRGAISGQKAHDQYVLSDGTGNVIVEINGNLLDGQRLANGTEVEVVGEVDKRLFGQPKVDARSVTILAAGRPGSPSFNPDPMRPKSPFDGPADAG